MNATGNARSPSTFLLNDAALAMVEAIACSSSGLSTGSTNSCPLAAP